jgi:hypothetical protein
MKAPILLTAAAAGILFAQLLAAQTVKPAARPGTQPAARPAGPWSKVPALPTACYSSQDTYWEQNAAALAEVQQARYAQDDINAAIRQRSIDNDDPMAMAARLQQKMMEDPANAQKYMEQMMAQNQRGQEETPAQLEKEQQIEAESDAVMKQYRAALTRARATGDARLRALEKRLQVPPGSASGMWVRMGDSGDPAWAHPERQAILKEWDRAYAATCPQWWSATGAVHAYLKRYKDFLVLERIPHEKEFMDKPRLEAYEMHGIDANGWRTTTDYEAVEDYLKMAAKLFGQREVDPWCRALEHCQ